MNKVCLIFSLLFAYSLASCEPCVCNDWAETLSCYGSEVDMFPDNITGITHIDIIDTSLTKFPNMTQFPDLISIDIQGNKLIDCNDVLAFKENATNLILTTDCDDNTSDFCHISKDCIQFCVNILSNHVI